MKMEHLLSELEKHRLVGRSAQLEMLRDQYVRRKTDWKMIYFYGPGGIGKSSLLRKFTCTLDPARAFYFDGHDSFLQPSQFLSQLKAMMTMKGHLQNEENRFQEDDAARLAERLNQAAEDAPILLLFDTFEKWTLIEHWLRRTWIPLLSGRVNVGAAGRFPLSGEWMKSPWSHIVVNIPLGPLSQAEMEEYLAVAGVLDESRKHAIARLAKGHPLALSIAVESAVHGRRQFSSESIEQQAVGRLVQVLLEDLASPVLHGYLEAASVVWRFHQDLIEQMTGKPVDAAVFRDLCKLSFVHACSGGWTLHDSVRSWIELEFRRRSPMKYSAYKQKALQVIQRYLKSADAAMRNLWVIDKLFLLDSDVLRHYVFHGSGENIETRMAVAADIPRLVELVQAYNLHVTPRAKEDTEQELLLQSIWEAAPDSVATFFHEDRLVGFNSFVPLNGKTRPIFGGHPVYSSYIKKSKPESREFLIWVGGVLPEYLLEAQGVTFRNLIDRFYGTRLVTVINCMEEFHPVLTGLGFVRIPWADYQSPAGLSYKAFQLDARESGFAVRVDAVLDQLACGRDEIPFDTIVATVKDSLSHYPELESQQALLSGLREIFSSPESEDALSFCRTYRARIIRSLDVLKRGTDQERLYESMLRYAYVQRIGTHDIVAARLRSSQSTYYRNLKKAITRLTQTMLEIG